MFFEAVFAIATAAAPTDPKLTAVIAYGNSLSYPITIKTCKKVAPDLREDLRTALEAWTDSHRDLIRQGHDIIVEEGMRTSTDTVAMIRDNSKWLDGEFRKKPVEEQVDRCKALLAEIREEIQHP